MWSIQKRSHYSNDSDFLIIVIFDPRGSYAYLQYIRYDIQYIIITEILCQSMKVKHGFLKYDVSVVKGGGEESSRKKAGKNIRTNDFSNVLHLGRERKCSSLQLWCPITLEIYSP